MKTECALADAAEMKLAQHPQYNDLRVVQSALSQRRDPSLWKWVGENSGRKRIRIWWEEGTVSIRSTTTTLYVLPLSVLAEDPCQGGTRFLVMQKNNLKVRLQLVFGHKLLQGQVISSEALERVEIKIRSINPTGSFALGQFICTSSPGTSPFEDKSGLGAYNKNSLPPRRAPWKSRDTGFWTRPQLLPGGEQVPFLRILNFLPSERMRIIPLCRVVSRLRGTDVLTMACCY